MKSRAKARGKIGASLQETALAQMTAMIAELERCRAPAANDAVHQLRRHVKNLRALLGLVGCSLGRKQGQAEVRCLREVGRSFGKLRDAQVLIDALDSLRKRYFERRRPLLLKELRELLLAEVDRQTRRIGRGEILSEATVALQGVRARCLGWDLAGLGWKEVLRAFRHSYECAREAARATAEDATVKRLHDWRKRAKELGEQARLLRRRCPPYLDELAHDLAVLGEFLGHDHDLAVLRNKITAERATLQLPRELAALLEVIDLRRGELIRTAIDLGERLFEESAREFARGLDRHHQQHRQTKREARKQASALVAGQNDSRPSSKR